VALGAAAALSNPAQAAYRSPFNAEGENAASAVYVTYATLNDMLHDTNRGSFISPDDFGFGRTIVGSGSDEMGAGGGAHAPEPSTLSLAAPAIGLFGALRRMALRV
jgi:hypothetical protein